MFFAVRLVGTEDALTITFSHHFTPFQVSAHVFIKSVIKMAIDVFRVKNEIWNQSSADLWNASCSTLEPYPLPPMKVTVG